MSMSATSPSAVMVAEALTATGPITITNLTKHTSLARSTVTAALKALEADGRATRSKAPGHTGTAPVADLWRLVTDTDQPPASNGAGTGERTEPDGDDTAEPTPETATVAGADVEQPDAVTGDNEPPTDTDPKDAPVATSDTDSSESDSSPDRPTRLRQGALRAMVQEFFTQHPGHEVTAGDVARMLTRSAGAVHNAIQHLITEGKVRQTGDNPRRYTSTT